MEFDMDGLLKSLDEMSTERAMLLWNTDGALYETVNILGGVIEALRLFIQQYQQDKKPQCPKELGIISSCDEGCIRTGYCPDYVDGKSDYEPPLEKDSE